MQTRRFYALPWLVEVCDISVYCQKLNCVLYAVKLKTSKRRMNAPATRPVPRDKRRSEPLSLSTARSPVQHGRDETTGTRQVYAALPSPYRVQLIHRATRQRSVVLSLDSTAAAALGQGT